MTQLGKVGENRTETAVCDRHKVGTGYGEQSWVLPCVRESGKVKREQNWKVVHGAKISNKSVRTEKATAWL